MLTELYFRNLAIVPEASIAFDSGLNVVTGGTGAGKSIVVDALELLAGARASQDLIRTGAESLRVVGLFRPVGTEWKSVLEEAGLTVAEEELVIRREVNRDGRNRVFVNDEPVTLRLLTRLTPGLLRIHTQREEMGLFESELQRSWLDQSGGAEAEKLLQKTTEAFAQVQDLERRLERLEGNQRERLERLDLLRFQLHEIDEAGMVAGEEDQLTVERDRLRHGETFRRSLGVSVKLLLDDESAAAARIARSRHALDELRTLEPQCDGWLKELDELQVRTEDIAGTLRQNLDRVDLDPRRLDVVESRLAVLERLFRKYGAGSTEVLAHHARVTEELSELEGDEQNGEQLRAERTAKLDLYGKAAAKLSQARRRWGKRLARSVGDGLSQLGLGHAQFEVRLETKSRTESPQTVAGGTVEFGPSGYDRAEFWFAPNPGQEAGPLARIASGGELSRVFLALQSTLQLASGGAERDGDGERRVMVFDEVDSGIGGAEAAALGKELKRLATAAQLIAVTHSPQVASFADQHFRVAKSVVDQQTEATVEGLDETARIEEIARMLGGEKVTRLTRSHAAELIEKAELDVA